MSINYNNVQVTSFNGGSSTTTSTANPVAGTVAGDLLIMYVVITYNSGLTPTITPPSGWTVAVEDETNTSFTPTYMVAYKIATGSDDYAITYTSTAGRREFFVMRFSGDYNLANLITAGTKSSGSATSFTAPSVTSIADSSMLLSFCATKSGTVSADDLAVPPTGMTLLKSSNVADISNQMAVAYQNAIPTGATGTKTWSSFIASANYGNTVNILINGLAITIDTINGDSSNPDVDVTASNTATTTGFSTITATTFTDASGFVSTATPSMPSGDGSFVFAWPWADGSQQAKFGSVTASMTDGTLTATLPSNMLLPSTYSSTTWSGATDLGEFYLGHYLTLTNDNRVYYQTVIDGITVTINPDGWMSFSNLPVTVPLLLHDCRTGGTGLITTKTLIVTESGAVVADTDPDAFTFTDVTGATASTNYESNVITVTGVTSGANIPTSISGSGGTNHQYAVSTDGGSTYGAWTSSGTDVQINYKIKVRLTSNATTSHGGGETASATLTVGGVSDTFTVTNAGVNTNPVVNSVLITELSGQIDASDGEGDTLTYTLTTDGVYGSAAVNSSSGAFTYTPDVSFTGNDSFVVTITDGYGGTTVVTVSIVDTLSGGYSIRLGVGYGIGIGF